GGADGRGPAPPGPVPGVPGVRVRVPLRRAVRQDHRLVQAGHGAAAAAGADAQRAAALDALPPDAVREPDALGAVADPSVAKTAAARRGGPAGPAAAAVAAGDARDPAAPGAALRPPARSVAGRRQAAGARGLVHRLRRRRLLPAD